MNKIMTMEARDRILGQFLQEGDTLKAKIFGSLFKDGRGPSVCYLGMSDKRVYIIEVSEDDVELVKNAYTVPLKADGSIVMKRNFFAVFRICFKMDGKDWEVTLPKKSFGTDFTDLDENYDAIREMFGM